MYWSHDVCIFGGMFVVAFGSFRCSWKVGSVRVALSVDRTSSRLLFGHCQSPLCSLACIAVAFSMYVSVCPFGLFCYSSIGVQSFTPSSHNGARCFSSLSEYLSSWHWFQIRLAQSFGCRFVGICFSRLALFSSTSLVVALVVVAVWLGAYKLGLWSSSAPEMC